MCGIAAFVNPSEQLLFSPAQLKRAARRLAHRGPDDEGFLLVDQNFNAVEAISELFEAPIRLQQQQKIDHYANQFFRIGLAHRRLSIIATDESGHQPMSSASSRFWISFNGEIYNYKEVKQDLLQRGYHFFTQTDTEVILKAWEVFGADCLSRFEGMWAMLIVDLKKGELYAAVDRSGVKPLYYWQTGRGICLASEIKTFQEFGHAYRPNLSKISRYLISGKTDESEETLFDGIYRLTGGRMLKINLQTGYQEVKQWHRWTLNNSLNKLSTKSEEETIGQLQQLFSESLALRLRSDVPIGVCLSGGIDSSAIAGSVSQWINAELQHPKKAFMARLQPNQPFDEFVFAQEMANRAGFEFFTTSPTAEDFQTNFTDLIYTLDEPPPGLNAFSQFAVFRLVASEGIKVSLDGQGADELFAGYPAHIKAWVMEAALRGNPKGNADVWIQSFRRLLPESWEFGLLKKYKPEFGLFSGPFLKWDDDQRAQIPTLNEVLLQDFNKQTLPFLLKAGDRNSMRWGVESRVPFADSHRLIELAFSIPGCTKIQHGLTKILLRKAMQGKIPQSILNRSDKIGFAAPNREWLLYLIKNGFEPPKYDEWGLSKPQLFGKLATSFQSENSSIDFHILWRAMAYWQWKKCFFSNE